MLRVPVLSRSGKPLMPTKASRARRWLKEGKAKIVHNDLECFAIQLTFETGENTQSIAIGIDPGKCYSGAAVQSSLATLWWTHLVLPFKTVKELGAVFLDYVQMLNLGGTAQNRNLELGQITRELRAIAKDFDVNYRTPTLRGMVWA
jgi:hypothetical protein